MKFSKSLKKVTLAMASVGMMVPQACQTMAAETNAPITRQQLDVVADVKLNSQGNLVGQVVDHQGNARANSVITFATMQGEIVSKTKTDAQGKFAASINKGGVYTVSGTMSSSSVRVWTQQAAPPSANSEVLMVDDNQAVRGNFFQNANGGPRVILIGTAIVVTTGAIISGINQNSGS